ncbi:hypothetical protein HY489_03970 [Candidatus Woesearchaeota archaeon]|nr:hypothetical protein [Candidatus Woesearchaeota archaeon]
MRPLNITRLVNGGLLVLGLLFFKPLAYFVAVMMIIAGLTNYCIMEKLLQRLGFKDGRVMKTSCEVEKHG